MTDALPYILLVDDEPINLVLLEELLQSEGYQTRSAGSGREALAIAQETPPALVLLDVMMPDMDGFEVCQQFRAASGLQQIPIIFLTALDDDDSRLRGLELLGDDYMTKPFQSKVVLAKIASLIRLSQLRQAPGLNGEAQPTPTQLRQQIQDQVKHQMSAAWKINEALSEKFRLFVPEQFLYRIAPQGVESIRLGNASEEEITVLFCDICDFTAIAEAQAASTTFEWLNVFFTQMNQVITRHQGFIDKFLGDALMAVFDRPQHHAQDALNTAVMMQHTLQTFNRDRTSFHLDHPLRIRIGIHTGQAIIGTLGSDRRMDSTVIGDAVNTASRIEELAKEYGCQTLVSDAAIAHLPEPEKFYLRRIDRVTPRGKQQAYDLYEVLGTPTTILEPDKVRSRSLFEQGMQAWKLGNPADALNYFLQIVAQDPSDSVAALYIQRCQTQLIEKASQQYPNITPLSSSLNSQEI